LSKVTTNWQLDDDFLVCSTDGHLLKFCFASLALSGEAAKREQLPPLPRKIRLQDAVAEVPGGAAGCLNCSWAESSELLY